ncbi:MAG: hypothetical protein OEL76_09855 [Siculibacillus sp.]|nr:hypothetical protein [Siculibacillus sp.]
MREQPRSTSLAADGQNGHVHLRPRRRDGVAPPPAGAPDPVEDHDHHHHHHGRDHGRAHRDEVGANGGVRPPPSLVRASLAVRLALAAVLSGLIWAGVSWALLPIAG